MENSWPNHKINGYSRSPKSLIQANNGPNSELVKCWFAPFGAVLLGGRFTETKCKEYLYLQEYLSTLNWNSDTVAALTPSKRVDAILCKNEILFLVISQGCRIVFWIFLRFVPLQFFHCFLQFFHCFLQFFPWFSSNFPWFSSIFPWFSSIPRFSSIFHGFLHCFLQFSIVFFIVFFNVLWFSSIFPWFSASCPWFSSIFPRFFFNVSLVFFNFPWFSASSIYIYICIYIYVYIYVYVGR